MHDTFALDGYYFPVLGQGVGSFVSVRVHGKTADLGSFIKRDGFGVDNVEIEKIIFTHDDCIRLGVRQGGGVTLADGRSYVLKLRQEPNDDFTYTYQVARK